MSVLKDAASRVNTALIETIVMIVDKNNRFTENLKREQSIALRI